MGEHEKAIRAAVVAMETAEAGATDSLRAAVAQFLWTAKLGKKPKRELQLTRSEVRLIEAAFRLTADELTP